MFRILFFIIIIFISIGIMPSLADAALVPCGTSSAPSSCSLCHLFELISNIISFILVKVVPPVGVLMFIIGGLTFVLAAGRPAWINKAKTILKNTAIGIIIIYASFLIISTILFAIAPQSVNTHFSIIDGGFEFNCDTSAIEFFVPPGLTRLEADARLRLDEEGHYEDGYQVDTPGIRALDLEREGLEIDPPSSANTINPAIDNYIQSAVATGIDPNFLRALIQAESSGNPNAVGPERDGQSAYGLMQVRPDTARRYDSSLSGLTDQQVGARLQDPNYGIEIGSAYLQDLSVKYNGNLDRTIAAYNGGPGANRSSRNCSGQLRWQCQWDDNAHTIRNTGYEETRNYVEKVRSLSGL